MDSSRTQKALDSSNEVTITVIGRRTGREYSIPTWFVRDGNRILLLPGGGFRSQWYKNAVRSKRIKLSSGQILLELTPIPIIDSTRLVSIVGRFREKYGPTYYSDPKKFEVALGLTLP